MNWKMPAALVAAALVGIGGTWGYQQWQQQQAMLAQARAALNAAKSIPATLPMPEPPKEEPAKPRTLASGPAFKYEYLEPRNQEELGSFYRQIRDADLLRQFPELRMVDGAFDFPRPLTFRTAECGSENAFYDPDDGSLTMCYEMLASLYMAARKDVEESNGKLPEEYPIHYMIANARFAMLHEFGHALIGELKLPATGREEDNADQVAVTLMLEGAHDKEQANDLALNLQLAAAYFMTTATAHTTQMMSDEHSLNEQRYFNIQCLLYGSNPGRYLRVVTSGRLPEDRALRCQDEASKVVGSWLTLLKPHLTPAFQAKDGDGSGGDAKTSGLFPRGATRADAESATGARDSGSQKDAAGNE